MQVTDLADAQYHIGTVVNQFHLSDDGFDFAWRGAENNITVKFFGFAKYLYLYRYGPPRVLMSGDNI